MQLSQKVDHQVSFRVVVDTRAGVQTISIVEEDPLAGDGAFPVEEAGEPVDELKATFSAARERGHRRVAEILSEDDMLSADAFSEFLAFAGHGQ